MLMARRQRRSKSRERREESSGVLPWKQRLLLVHQLLKGINRDNIAVRLYNNVANHLHETITELGKLDTDSNAKWDELVDHFVDSRDFYVDKADTLSLFTADISPFHLFDAIANGLSFDEGKAKQLENPDDREAWLGYVLSNVGKRIENLDSSKHGYFDYFDRAISRGSGVLFLKIAKTLQGIHGRSVVIDDTYDWRTALERVLDKVHQIKKPDNMFVGAIYEEVKIKLSKTIKKLQSIPKGDLNKEGNWNLVYKGLHERMILFESLSAMPIVKDLFHALHSGLQVIGSSDEWNSMEGDREHVMEVVLKSMGSKLKGLNKTYYDKFLPAGGGEIMAEIADILTGVGK